MTVNDQLRRGEREGWYKKTFSHGCGLNKYTLSRLVVDVTKSQTAGVESIES